MKSQNLYSLVSRRHCSLGNYKVGASVSLPLSCSPVDEEKQYDVSADYHSVKQRNIARDLQGCTVRSARRLQLDRGVVSGDFRQLPATRFGCQAPACLTPSRSPRIHGVAILGEWQSKVIRRVNFAATRMCPGCCATCVPMREFLVYRSTAHCKNLRSTSKDFETDKSELPTSCFVGFIRSGLVGCRPKAIFRSGTAGSLVAVCKQCAHHITHP